MNKLIYVLVLVCMASCTEEQSLVFDKSPEERVDAVLKEYKSVLTAGDGLWLTYYGGEAILMKFNEDNTVEFNSSFRGGAEDRTITYRVASSQVPELTFESHSVFHALYEEELMEREYEFLFETVSNDRIEFVSKTDIGDVKTKLTFFKGNVDDLVKVAEMKQKLVNHSFFKSIEVEGSDYSARIITFTNTSFVKEVLPDGQTIISQHDLGVTKTGLTFYPALMIDGVEVNSFSYLDEGKVMFKADVDTKNITIKEMDELLLTEKGVVQNDFLRKDFKTARYYSYKLDSVNLKLKAAIPEYKAIQFYVLSGAVMCYAPGKEGGNWAGFVGYTFREDPGYADYHLITKLNPNSWGQWYREVRDNDGYKLLKEFLLHDKGLYVEKVGPEAYVVVSHDDPSLYLMLSNI
ncbi:MAG: DUF4302 domain-containing protein [Carboxylicivirga sp.]|nr:DUF4302 domain-containing protein [Carboxylicivirga sp.]